MDQKRNQDRKQDLPNRASNMEKAEGSRENVRNSGGGIPNRPMDKEKTEKSEQAKDDGSSLKTQI